MTRDRVSTAAEKGEWLQAHAPLWRDLPERQTEAAPGLKALRALMVAAHIYSPKTTGYDVEVSIFRAIARMRQGQRCA